jgi:hypothetical protein
MGIYQFKLSHTKRSMSHLSAQNVTTNGITTHLDITPTHRIYISFPFLTFFSWEEKVSSLGYLRLLNQMVDFNEIWHESFANGGHTNLVLLTFLSSVIRKSGKHEHVRWERQ